MSSRLAKRISLVFSSIVTSAGSGVVHLTRPGAALDRMLRPAEVDVGDPDTYMSRFSPEALGDARPDLRGVAVDGLLAGEHEVHRLRAPDLADRGRPARRTSPACPRRRMRGR